MSTKAAHTPTPWGVCTSKMAGDLSATIQEIIIMRKGNPRYVGTANIAQCWDRKEIGRNGGLKEDEAKANAELIVTAVNHHQELITRLYNLVNAIETQEADSNPNNLTLRMDEARETLKKVIQ